MNWVMKRKQIGKRIGAMVLLCAMFFGNTSIAALAEEMPVEEVNQAVVSEEAAESVEEEEIAEIVEETEANPTAEEAEPMMAEEAEPTMAELSEDEEQIIGDLADTEYEKVETVEELDVTADLEAVEVGIENFASATPMRVGKDYLIDIENENGLGYFSFTPEQDGEYEFCSISGGDIWGWLYDSYGEEITDDDNSGEGYNFSIASSLKANTTYYLETGCHESYDTETYTVRVIPTFRLEYDYDVRVKPNESVNLKVEVTDYTGTLNYQWYHDGEAIKGATLSELVLNNITETGHYACKVKDDYSMRWARFHVYIDSGFSLLYDDEVTVELNGSTTLKVGATSDAGTLSYQWYEDYEEIEGATSAELEIENITKYEDYSCRVSDGYNISSLWFEVDVDSSLSTCTHTNTYKEISREAATCGKAGSVTYLCSNCGVMKTDTLAATGNHEYGAYTVTKASTVLAEGEQVRTCKVCGAKQTAPVAKFAKVIKLNVTSLPMKVKQSTTAVKVTQMATGDYITSWKSSNTKVVTVNSKGKITAKKKGTAKITVTLASGASAKVTVKVQTGTVKTKKVSVTSKKLTLKKKQKVNLGTTLSPLTSQQKVTYTTSNKKVATVSKKGVVTAKGKGKAKITVKSGSKKVTVTVTVK